MQELFRVEKRSGFLKLVEAILRMSGGQMEATSLSRLCGLSRPTVVNYLDVPSVLQPYTRKIGGLDVTVTGPNQLFLA